MNQPLPPKSSGISDTGIGIFFLGLSVPVILLLYFILGFLSPYLVSHVDISEIHSKFTPGFAGHCNPKPAEQLRYIIAIVLVPVIYLGAFFYHHHKRKQGKAFFQTTQGRYVAQISQVGISIVLITSFLYQELLGFRYFTFNQIIYSLIFSLLILSLAYKKITIRFSPFFNHRLFSKVAPWATVLFLATLCILPAIVTEQNILKSHDVLTYHLAFYIGEFFSTLSKKAAYVNFYPQYQNLLALILSPIFFLFGFKVSVLTLSLASLSFISLILVFKVFSKITGSTVLGFVFFLPVLAGGIYCLPNDTNSYAINEFLYFANWPIRLFGPCLLLYALTRFFESKQGNRNKFLTYMLGGLVAINNVDFGVPAFVALVASISVWDVIQKKHFHILNLLKSLALATTAFLAAISLFFISTLIFSGHFPNLSSALSFQYIFAKYGFMMLQAPRNGFHWIIYFTFMFAIVRSLVLISITLHPSKLQKLKISSLLFSGIFGAGSMMYFMGRSHAYTLVVFFFTWALSLMLLIHDFYEKFEVKKIIHFIPAVFYAFSYSLLISILFYQSPHFETEVSRILSTDAPIYPDLKEINTWLSKYVSANEKVAILYPYGDLIARDLRLINTFSFAHPFSILLLKQVDLTMEEILRSHTLTVFGQISVELKQKLIDHQFKQLGEFNGSVLKGSGLWRKN